MEGMVNDDNEPGRWEMYGLALLRLKLTTTFETADVLHTFAPTGKYWGPKAGLLLSRPITFQVEGVTVMAAVALESVRSREIRMQQAMAKSFAAMDEPLVFDANFISGAFSTGA